MRRICNAIIALVLIAAMLCPASAADAAPVLLMRDGGDGTIQLALDGLGDQDVSSIQLSFTLDGSCSEAAFTPGSSGQYGTCQVEESGGRTRIVLYLDSLKNLNQAGLAYLGTLKLGIGYAVPSSAQLISLDHRLEGSGGTDISVRSVSPDEAGSAVRGTTTDHGTLDIQPGSAVWGTTVTITAHPEDGYRLSHLNAVCGGYQIPVTKRGGGTYTFTMPGADVELQGVFTSSEPLPFTDVKETSWYYDAVRFAYEKELMSGVSDTVFSPNQSIDRGMIVTVLHRMAGSPAGGNAGFTDVAADRYYAEAVTWAASAGVVTGYGDGRFGPQDSITREQMAVILWRYAKMNGKDVSAQADLSSFTDSAQIHSYAVEAMRWANAVGLINGTGATTLSPCGTATRAQAVQLLERFYKNVLS